MNILDAIKSGKPYKRKVHGSYYSVDYKDGFSTESILANDWEIQEDLIYITKSTAYMLYNAGACSSLKNFDMSFEAICKELGFKS